MGIVAAILDVTNSGASKTKIMYGANLSFSMLEKYLKLVQSSDLIEKDGDRLYHLTDKGRDFLNAYKRFYDRYDSASKLLSSLAFERQRLSKLCKDDLDADETEYLMDAE